MAGERSQQVARPSADGLGAKSLADFKDMLAQPGAMVPRPLRKELFDFEKLPMYNPAAFVDASSESDDGEGNVRDDINISLLKQYASWKTETEKQGSLWRIHAKELPGRYWLRVRSAKLGADHWRDLANLMIYWLAPAPGTGFVESGFSLVTKLAAQTQRRRLDVVGFKRVVMLLIYKKLTQDLVVNSLAEIKR